MNQCMDCNSWMDWDYVIENASANDVCAKCGGRSLMFHASAESCCGQAYDITVEDRTERFMQSLEELVELEVAA